MTWGEFKTWVAAQGAKDTDEISWIDVNTQDDFPGKLEFSRDDDTGALEVDYVPVKP